MRAARTLLVLLLAGVLLGPTAAQATHEIPTLNFKLRGHLTAVVILNLKKEPSEITPPPHFFGCKNERDLIVQRSAGGAWKKAGRGQTNDNGRMRLRIDDRGGKHRVVLKKTEACRGSISATLVHKH